MLWNWVGWLPIVWGEKGRTQLALVSRWGGTATMFGGNHAEDVMCSNPDELLQYSSIFHAYYRWFCCYFVHQLNWQARKGQSTSAKEQELKADVLQKLKWLDNEFLLTGRDTQVEEQVSELRVKRAELAIKQQVPWAGCFLQWLLLVNICWSFFFFF